MTRHEQSQSGRRRNGNRSAGIAFAAVLCGGLAAAAGADVDVAEGFRCESKEASGIAEADARTAVRIVCDELRRESGARGAFLVSLATLGPRVLVTASREDSPASVTVQVQGLDELPTAAPRIAEALVRGRLFASTQRVDNLLLPETRQALTKKGSVKFSLGVADIESPGHGARGSGLAFGLVYTAPRFALPAEMRFGWDDAQYGEKQLGLFSLSLGARSYLSTRDSSPFVGGGLGYLHLSASEGMFEGPSGHFDGSRSGVAPYVEGGVEMLRTHRGRLALQVRVDFPTGSLRSEPYLDYTCDASGRCRSDPTRSAPSRYVVPITIGASLAF